MRAAFSAINLPPKPGDPTFPERTDRAAVLTRNILPKNMLGDSAYGVAWSMDKRLEKRHKRQVSRAKKKLRLSEPDVRTREQIEAAREASRADTSRGNKPRVAVSGGFRNTFAATTGNAAKTDS